LHNIAASLRDDVSVLFVLADFTETKHQMLNLNSSEIY